MAWGVTPEGLASFNRLVGVEHVLRPFELEYVDLPPQRDPILSGLSARDVAMETTEKIFPWAGVRYRVDDQFTWIVDLEDIAPFCAIPGATAGDRAAARRAVANWPRNMFSGFTNIWKLIYYTSGHARIHLARHAARLRLAQALADQTRIGPVLVAPAGAAGRHGTDLA